MTTTPILDTDSGALKRLFSQAVAAFGSWAYMLSLVRVKTLCAVAEGLDTTGVELVYLADR
jgi:hypothetical protein